MSKLQLGRISKLEDSLWDDVYEWCHAWIEQSFDVEDLEDLTSDQLWAISNYADKMFEEEEEAKANFQSMSTTHGMVMSTLYNIINMHEHRMEEDEDE